MAPEPTAAFDWRQPRSWTRQPWWPWTRRIVGIVFFALVAWLVVSRARTIEWGSVWQSLRDIPASVLGMAGLVTLLTYCVYCSFDLIGRHRTGHRLPAPLVVFITFISYAFNLNLGTLVGGVAFRFRLYRHYGLHSGQIAHVTALSMITNWTGYCALAGVVYLVWPLALPPQWELGAIDMRWLGALALSLALAYTVLCAWRGGEGGRELTVGGQAVPVPGWRLAVFQQALSSLHWMLMAGIIFVLLDGRASYTAVLATLLIAAIAGVLAHVPAGLGVIEAVFVALLGHQVDEARLLAALLAYRGVYYIAPLALAATGYLVIELRRRRGAPHDRPDGTAPGDSRGA